MSSVLLVDDNTQLLDLYKILLERAGHQVRIADNCGAAISLLHQIDPDVVIMDLRMPAMEDGLNLIRTVKDHTPQGRAAPAKLVVISGWTEDLLETPENHQVDCVLPKPVRIEALLRSISELALMLFLFLAAVRPGLCAAFRFTARGRAEIVADLEISSPGSNWAEVGHEAALAALTVDGRTPQHIMLYAGAEPHTYSAFLGEIAAGEHELRVDPETKYSARSAEMKVLGATFREVAAADPYWTALAHAPVLYARANTIGRFTDIPMLSYCEQLTENGKPLLQYTMIFSNEDGGTSTRALMARWGRTTDVEYIYRAWLDAHGAVERATIQARDHKEVEFRGHREGSHPVLIPSTDNNMVADVGTSPIRYQIPPFVMDLAAHSREQIMDEHPIAYRVMAQELQRENKLRPFGAVDGEKVSDPRNYLYVEAKVANQNSALATLIRLRGESRWLSSHLGRNDYAISRDGWIRTTVELPPATKPAQIEEIAFECLVYVDEDQPPPLAGTCRLERVSKMFFLDKDYRPGPSVWSHGDPAEIPTGQIRAFSAGE